MCDGISLVQPVYSESLDDNDYPLMFLVSALNYCRIRLLGQWTKEISLT